MGDDDVPHAAPAVESISRRGRPRAGPYVALAAGLLSALAAWLSVTLGPWTARRAVARLDYENVYTSLYALWALTVVLGVAAVALGLYSLRRPTSEALSGAAVGIGTSSILGVAVYVLGTWLVLPALG